MKQNRAVVSLLLFGISVIILFVWTGLESAFLNMSPNAERIVTFVMLVLPAAVGASLGVMSLIRREEKTKLAITAIILNTLFALFHLMIVVFAG